MNAHRSGRRIAIGVGNRDRGDDAVGPMVCDRVGARAPHPETWVIESDPSTLVVTWCRDDRVVLVDAVVTGAPPGTVHRLDPRSLAAGPALSTHGIGVADTIRLSDVLGTRPDQLWIIGVEGESFEPGASLSPAVSSVLDAVVAKVLALLDVPVPASSAVDIGR